MEANQDHHIFRWWQNPRKMVGDVSCNPQKVWQNLKENDKTNVMSIFEEISEGKHEDFAVSNSPFAPRPHLRKSTSPVPWLRGFEITHWTRGSCCGGCFFHFNPKRNGGRGWNITICSNQLWQPRLVFFSVFLSLHDFVVVFFWFMVIWNSLNVSFFRVVMSLFAYFKWFWPGHRILWCSFLLRELNMRQIHCPNVGIYNWNPWRGIPNPINILKWQNYLKHPKTHI